MNINSLREIKGDRIKIVQISDLIGFRLEILRYVIARALATTTEGRR